MQSDLDAYVFIQPIDFVFMQDSAPSHRAKATGDFLQSVVLILSELKDGH